MTDKIIVHVEVLPDYLAYKFKDGTIVGLNRKGLAVAYITAEGCTVKGSTDEYVAAISKYRSNIKTEKEIEFYDTVAIAAMQSYMLDKTRITSASDRTRFAFDMADLMLAERRRRLGAQR